MWLCRDYYPLNLGYHDHLLGGSKVIADGMRRSHQYTYLVMYLYACVREIMWCLAQRINGVVT